MKTLNSKTIAAAVLATLLATVAYAAPKSNQDRMSPEAKLATVPGLSQAQRDDIMRIEKESREAQRALMKKMHEERQNLRSESTRKLRAALGDKAYADYVTWKLEHRRGHRADRHQRRGDRDGRRAHRRGDTQDAEEMDSDTDA